MYSAYGDESRDGSGKRVYAVSGVFGHASDWKAIRKPWKQRLGGLTFHASDCQSGGGDFKNICSEDRRKLYRDLVRLIAGSKLIAVAGAIAVSEYYDVFPSDRALEHAPYLWLFGDITLQMAQFASVCIPRQRVKITFDRHPEIEHNASLLYDFVRRSPDQTIINMLSDEVSFATRKTMGIQVADLIAREAMNRLDDQLIGKSRVRGSFAALRDSKRFQYSFLRRQYFSDTKKKIENSSLRNKLSLTQYHEWVRDNGIQDCQTNRLRFLDAKREELTPVTAP